jgi:hypothetical protein
VGGDDPRGGFGPNRIWVDRPIERQDTADQSLEHITQHISTEFEGAP